MYVYMLRELNKMRKYGDFLMLNAYIFRVINQILEDHNLHL